MRFFLVLPLSLLLAAFLWCDSSDLASIDFSEARISQAGPESFFIRSVKTRDGFFSISIVRSETDGRWRIDRVLPEDRSIIPEGLVLDFATLSKTDGTEIEIGGILYNGRVYKGRIGLDEGGLLFPPESFEETRFSAESIRRASVLKDLMLPSYDEQVKALHEAEKKELLERITRIEESNAALDREIQARKEREKWFLSQKEGGDRRIADLERRNGELGGEVEALKARLESLKAEKELLVQEAAAAKKTEGGARVWLEPAESRPPRAEVPAAVPRGDLEDRVFALEREVENLNRKIAALATSGYRIDRQTYSRNLLSGFTGARPKLGNWKVTLGQAEQLDAKQYFAKLSLPVRQENKRTLYSFQTRSTGKGWVGVGLHIFVEDSRKPRGYGEGKSLLVWLTRDPATYHNEAAYLQLYRSDDDIHMERVLDAKVSETLGDYLSVDILYDPPAGYITVALNGEEKVRYKTFFGIDSGVSVALRTLGSGGSFRNLSVSTAP